VDICGGEVIKGIIYDFDGVIADSELLANLVLAEAVTSLGLPTTLDDSIARYMGKRWAEIETAIATGTGRPVPAGFLEDMKRALVMRFREALKPVPGAEDFIRTFAALPRCVASSSATDRLQLSMDVLGFGHLFPDAVFSADLVRRGKPHPDIFLYAADKIGVAPVHCLVVEDSPNGIRAGVAAGMCVVGLCAGAHVRAGHAERLRDAGAEDVFDSWAEVAGFLATRL
jgi:HAD superfamily hydrolase (TIGR01509 family)